MYVRKLLTIVAVLALAVPAWGAVSFDDFENATLGDINGQTSGSGWANNNMNYWNGPSSADGRNFIQVVEGGPTGQFVKAWGLDTRSIDRNFNEALHNVDDLQVSFDFTIVGGITNDFNFYVNEGGTTRIHFEFRVNGDIRVRGPDVVIGNWKDAGPHKLLDEWKLVEVDIDVANQQYDLTIGGSLVGADQPFRSGSYTLDHVRFMMGKSDSTCGTTYWGLDNVLVVPEPASLLLLASSVLFLRRRRS